MKKLTQFVGVFAVVYVSAAALSGCSSTTDPGMNSPGGGGTSGTAGAGVGGSTQLAVPNTFTELMGADATPGATPAPAGWTSGGCNVCHGANGEGFPGIGPEIRHVPTVYANWVVRNGRPNLSAMVAFPQVAPNPQTLAISDADLAAVLAWLQGQPKPTTGQGLYKDFCGNCHGPAVASGGAVAISIIGKTALEITQKVRTGEGMDPAMRNGYMPAEDMTALTDAELALIQGYLMAK